MRQVSGAFFFLTLLVSTSASAELCKSWSAPVKVGALDTAFLTEASGMAFSRTVPGRLFHNNDSGDGAFFYMTDSAGAHTQKIEFNRDTPTDIEDMSVGPCSAGSCLFLADIGDNGRKRTNLTVWIIPELAQFEGSRASSRPVLLAYPDGPHDAESLAIHPITGDLYLLTKEYSMLERRAAPAHLYKVAAERLKNYADAEVLSLEPVSIIDLPYLNYDFGLFGQQATSMDIRPDGLALVILTYDNIVEVDFTKALEGDSRKWSEGPHYSILRLYGLLSQMEAVTYAPDGKSVFIESEFNPDNGDKEAPIFQARCAD